MVGKKKWSPFELCLVHVMLKTDYSPADIVRHFPVMFPHAKHAVTLSSVKHVSKEYLQTPAYAQIEQMWEDLPGKKGYLLGLTALEMDLATITQQIVQKYPSHNWPERIAKTDAVDMGISTFHSCAKILGAGSLIQEYDDPATGLPAAVLQGFERGDSAEEIYRKCGNAVPFDHVVFILTKWQEGFWSEWMPAAEMGRPGGAQSYVID